MNKYICWVLLSIFIGFIHADEIYQYIDNKGNTVISNKPAKNASKLDLPALAYTASTATGSDTSNKNNSRTEILKGELEREKKALVDTQSLIEQNKNFKIANNDKEQKLAKERLITLETAQTEHKKNIEILTKQLAGQ